ncbi:MAG: DNA recombination protein RmuC [Alphaproteobacteria bacterium]|nr:DNA recombination protein RmuC [Alphaproteobacteria bacterium]MDD9919853.1 DNA recombination protein RmuC [Alphaproteobacteria bacterium]
MDVLFLVIGLVLGLIIGLGIGFWRVRDVTALHKSMTQQKQQETDALLAQMRESFSALSLEALSKSTEEFLKVAETKLGQQTQANSKEMDGKKSLIDQTLQGMKSELNKVQDMVQTIEKDRKAKFDVLTQQITLAADETKRLTNTTSSLQAALANSRVRGQWGDRMAEDVLRLAGFVEGINYQKQLTKSDAETTTRPDYTFYMPQERVVHMDVKFPLENYLLWLDADTPTDKEKFLKQFLKDARARVKEAAKRGYAEGADTLDYVLVFIPNEQVYTFLHEQDRALLDDAMKDKVILCSPVTLYAILAVIRQAVDNFHLERTAGQILDLLNDFHGQWDKFCEAMEKLGGKIDSSQQEFQKLTTTRRNMLERPIQKMQALRQTENLPTNHLKIIEGAKN